MNRPGPKEEVTVVGGIQCGDCDDAYQKLCQMVVEMQTASPDQPLPPPPPKPAESLRVLIGMKHGWVTYDQLIVECQRCGGFVGRFTLLQGVGNAVGGLGGVTEADGEAAPESKSKLLIN